MNKPIKVTSLTVRFYMKDGWVPETLNRYIVQGKCDTVDYGTPEEYYVIPPYTKLSIKKLYRDGHIGVLENKDMWPELQSLTDEEILFERLNYHTVHLDEKEDE